MPVDPYLGDISMFAGNFAPRGWAFCDGQLLPISQYSALFSILGTMYGGDGRTTFALPDLRGRVPMGHGAGPGLTPRNTFGQKGGNEFTTLTTANMPNHTHAATLHAEAAVGTSGNPTNQMLGIITGDTKIYAPLDPANNVVMSSESITVSAEGGNQSFSNEQPFLVLAFIIALQGVFPSRS
ncbi:hypothetical protein A8B78_14090 [Jannaschia sp. EhC01]|nr:hypothetical protein A8B78_14090 [Jannaschia sp. EhC01]